MTLGQKITELRKSQSLTQERLSEKLGVSRQTIANWEADSTNPDINQAKAIAELFQVRQQAEVLCVQDIAPVGILIDREILSRPLFLHASSVKSAIWTQKPATSG